jgi:hypothetical protein
VLKNRVLRKIFGMKFMVKFEEKRPGPRLRREDHIKMNLKEVE